MTKKAHENYTVPGLSRVDGHKVGDSLQARLHALNDLHLTLKHAHWNVTGPNFIAVHEMLDPQVDLVRTMVDEIAERMATLGVSPNGLTGPMAAQLEGTAYPLGRADSSAHLEALDAVYTRVLEDHRETLDSMGKFDPITEDMLINQISQLELFQWFMRSHLGA